ncbi:MAG: hypothetical protein VYA32_07610 [Planctomycetota bacterium]|nr:hypothetical protein [Planctomycetota bacterium]
MTRDELTARRSFDDYLGNFQGWCQEAASESFGDLERSQVAIRKKLVRIGYHDADPFDPDPSKIFPGWIVAHPAVIAARQRHDQLRERSLDISGRQENRLVIADLELTLSAAVEMAIA